MPRVRIKNLIKQVVTIMPAVVVEGQTKFINVDIPPFGSVTIDCDPSKGDLNAKKSNKIITVSAA